MSGEDFGFYKSHSELEGDFVRLFLLTAERHHTDAFLADCMLLMEVCARKLLAYHEVSTETRHGAIDYVRMCSVFVPSLARVMDSLSTSERESLELASSDDLMFSGHSVKPSVSAMRKLCEIALAEILLLEVLEN